MATDLDKERLLKEDEDGLSEPPVFRRKNTRLQLFVKYVMPHLVVLLIYTAFFVLAIRITAHECPDEKIDEPFSPAAHVMQWRKQMVNSTKYEKSPYSGNPSPEVDAAWNQLLFGFTLRVSKNALDQIGKTSIPLSDGSGDYIAGLDTTHHLHCLMNIRHALAPDYYAEELKHTSHYKHPDDVYPTHIEHCIEILRMQLMCRGDASLFTYGWDMSKREPLTDFAVEHTCSDWRGLESWAEQNSFNVQDDLLIHPVYGKWPNGGPV